MLRLRNVEAGYGTLKVLRKVSMHVGAREIVTIIGANGAGKTTLLATIAGLLRPRSGEIAFDGGEIAGLPAERIVFRGCSLVPEGRQLFGPMTVRENIVLGAYPQYRKDGGKAVRADLDRVYGIFPRLKERERQLVRGARDLLGWPGRHQPEHHDHHRRTEPGTVLGQQAVRDHDCSKPELQ